MALEPNHDPLERAREAAREERPEGWVELSESIMTRVRAVVTPSEPILTYTELGTTDRDGVGSTTRVSARIVVAALRRLLQQPTHAPDDIELTITDERLTAVHLMLVCSYGVDLLPLAEAVRAQVVDEIVAHLGPDPAFTPADVTIDIVDIVLGDPNLL